MPSKPATAAAGLDGALASREVIMAQHSAACQAARAGAAGGGGPVRSAGGGGRSPAPGGRPPGADGSPAERDGGRAGGHPRPRVFPARCAARPPTRPRHGAAEPGCPPSAIEAAAAPARRGRLRAAAPGGPGSMRAGRRWRPAPRWPGPHPGALAAEAAALGSASRRASRRLARSPGWRPNWRQRGTSRRAVAEDLTDAVSGRLTPAASGTPPAAPGRPGGGPDRRGAGLPVGDGPAGRPAGDSRPGPGRGAGPGSAGRRAGGPGAAAGRAKREAAAQGFASLARRGRRCSTPADQADLAAEVSFWAATLARLEAAAQADDLAGLDPARAGEVQRPGRGGRSRARPCAQEAEHEVRGPTTPRGPRLTGWANGSQMSALPRRPWTGGWRRPSR